MPICELSLIFVNIGTYCLFSVNSAPTVLNCWYESNGIFLYICVRFCFYLYFPPFLPGMRCQSRLNYSCHRIFQKEDTHGPCSCKTDRDLLFMLSLLAPDACFVTDMHGNDWGKKKKSSVFASPPTCLSLTLVDFLQLPWLRSIRVTSCM